MIIVFPKSATVEASTPVRPKPRRKRKPPSTPEERKLAQARELKRLRQKQRRTEYLVDCGRVDELRREIKA